MKPNESREGREGDEVKQEDQATVTGVSNGEVSSITTWNGNHLIPSPPSRDHLQLFTASFRLKAVDRSVQFIKADCGSGGGQTSAGVEFQ